MVGAQHDSVFVVVGHLVGMPQGCSVGFLCGTGIRPFWIMWGWPEVSFSTL